VLLKLYTYTHTVVEDINMLEEVQQYHETLRLDVRLEVSQLEKLDVPE
jgi:hypothetical protein